MAHIMEFREIPDDYDEEYDYDDDLFLNRYFENNSIDPIEFIDVVTCVGVVVLSIALVVLVYKRFNSL
jgi:hypothetical protein